MDIICEKTFKKNIHSELAKKKIEWFFSYEVSVERKMANFQESMVAWNMYQHYKQYIMLMVVWYMNLALYNHITVIIFVSNI